SEYRDSCISQLHEVYGALQKYPTTDAQENKSYQETLQLARSLCDQYPSARKEASSKPGWKRVLGGIGNSLSSGQTTEVDRSQTGQESETEEKHLGTEIDSLAVKITGDATGRINFREALTRLVKQALYATKVAIQSIFRRRDR
ncbi:MAG: hypothetical protein KDD60_04985, partial [Bdellovibrionales bacterium]|nr:hypothetical protein [Bdellovibrionales bacterium]